MATCKDCLHVDVCCSYLSTAYNKCKLAAPDFELLKNIECDECQHFKDRSQFVELPCKVGDKAFSLVGKGEIEKWTVTDIYFSDFGVADINILQIKVRSEDKDKGASFPSYYLGRSFFYTYEEAEQALKEREKND